MARSISGARFTHMCRAELHACRFILMIGQFDALPSPYISGTLCRLSLFSFAMYVSLEARDERGAGARLARNLQWHLCLYPFDKKIGMKCIGRKLGSVLLLETTHFCNFIECFLAAGYCLLSHAERLEAI